MKTLKTDDDGNKLTLVGDEIRLWLADKSTYKILGMVNKLQQRIETFRDVNKHLLRKADAYGFNYELLSLATYYETILLREVSGRRVIGVYLIPIIDILDGKEFLWFKTQGFERQIFMRRSLMKEYKINKPTLRELKI